MLVDNGASIILGHHPHFVQGIERYKHGLITYSLGNFQFNTNHSKLIDNKTDESFILVLNFSEDDIKSYEIIPVKINKDYIPYILEEKEKEE